MLVIKRNGDIAPFEFKKVEQSIILAMKDEIGTTHLELAHTIAKLVEELVQKEEKPVPVKEIEEHIRLSLMKNHQILTAEAFINYRSLKEYKDVVNTTDESIAGLLKQTNEETMNENSNKNATRASTQRDLIAGEVSKDMAKRYILPVNILRAHEQGIIHIHDLDYMIQSIPNCCLVNMKDMLDNGTVINGKMIDSPNSFLTACTVATQILSKIAGAQYGGQTISLAHLAPYIRKSKERYYNLLKDTISSQEELEQAVHSLLRKEVASGVQTLQYQIITLSTTNGR